MAYYLVLDEMNGGLEATPSPPGVPSWMEKTGGGDIVSRWLTEVEEGETE